MNITMTEAMGYSVLGFAIVFLMLIILMGIIVILGRLMAAKPPVSEKKEEVKAAPAAPVVQKEKAPGSAGSIELHGVEPKKAAMIMAIVADELGKPVNELRFISIREIEA